MQPTSSVVTQMDPYAMYGGVPQEYTSPRKDIKVEPSKEKEPSSQYSPPRHSSSPQSSRETSPKVSDFKKRKRGRPPLEKDSRSCTNCGTSETPEWRKGPLGPHTLCNACGLQWMKAQKRENELKTKYEEARKKNSLLRVLNSQGGNTSTVNPLNLCDPRGNSLVDMGSDNSSSGELSSRYSPEMDTLPADAVSPTMNSPMQSIPTPITMDTLNTLKAIQTINALSHMNHMNHVNTLNHLNIMGTPNSLSSDPSLNLSSNHYTQPHTVINHYNSNVNTYTSNSYNLAAELSAPLARYPPLNPQQVFLNLNYSPMMNSPSQYNSPYLPHPQHQPVKDFTAHPSMNVHASPPTPTHHNTSLLTSPQHHSLSSHPHTHPPPHHPHHSHTSPHHHTPHNAAAAHSHSLLQAHVHNPLLHPSSTLIPNPQTLNTDDSVTGGGQM